MRGVSTGRERQRGQRERAPNRPRLECALDACGNSVLHVAVLRRAEACVRFILATGCRAAIETKNSVGWTPLLSAVFHGQLMCVKQLIRRCARV